MNTETGRSEGFKEWLKDHKKGLQRAGAITLAATALAGCAGRGSEEQEGIKEITIGEHAFNMDEKIPGERFYKVPKHEGDGGGLEGNYGVIIMDKNLITIDASNNYALAIAQKDILNDGIQITNAEEAYGLINYFVDDSGKFVGGNYQVK